MSDEPRETLRRLEQRLSQASDAAERLIAEAARAPRRGSPPPPAGWQAPPGERGEPGRRTSELELLLSGLRIVSELVPAEVVERLAAALRELLLALRALLDYYIERLERPHAERGTVQDIPID